MTKNKLEEQNYVLENEISKLKNEIKILENKDKDQIANTIDIINEYKDEAVKTLDELKLLFKKIR